MSLLSRDLKIHLLPENSIELIANSSSTPLNSHNTKELCFQHYDWLRRRLRCQVGSRRFFPVPREAFFDALLCAITDQSTVVSFRVRPNCVLSVRRSAGVRRLAEEFFTDPTLRYLVSFLLRNLVEYNIECLLRPFKVLWSPLRSSVSLSLAQHLEGRSLLPSPRVSSTFFLVC